MPRSDLLAPARRYAGTFGLGLCVLAVYACSLCPDVYLIDSGELAAVSWTLGIAHPTGYPLYTLISHLFSHLPGEPVRNLNLFSALLTVGAALFLHRTVRRIARNAFVPILVVSLFAFAPVIWRVSITNEVYPLTVLFIAALIYLLDRMEDDRVFYFFMYVAGLSLTNHMMVLSFALPLLVYVIIVRRPGRRAVCAGILFLAFGSTVYLYLIARTRGGAHLAWGNAGDLQRLYWHVSGKQYQVWMFTSSIGQIFSNLIAGLRLLGQNLLYVFAAPSVYGFVVLYRQDRARFWLFVAVIAANLLYAINYSIPDIEPYYIPSFIALIIGLAYGLGALAKYAKPLAAVAAALAIPLLNHNACTLRGNRFGMDFGRAHIAALPDSALLITNHWDVYSPLIYLRHVRQERKDLVIIDKELLRRTWYLRHLEQEYPWFYARAKHAVDAYLVELRKFEYGRPYQPHVIQARYIDLLNCFIDVGLERGAFLAAPWPDRDLSQARPLYPRLPFGLVHQVTPDGHTRPFDFTSIELKPPPLVNDDRLRQNLEMVRRTLRASVHYFRSTGNHEQAARASRILESF